MKKISLVLFLTIALPLLGCSSTKVLTADYPEEIQGTGGAKEVVDGVDFWVEGTPNCKYRVLSVVQDDAYTTGNLLANAMSKAGAKSRLVKEAKKAGANGIIYLDQQYEGLGHTASGQVNRFGHVQGSSVSRGIVTRKVALVKYL